VSSPSSICQGHVNAHSVNRGMQSELKRKLTKHGEKHLELNIRQINTPTSGDNLNMCKVLFSAVSEGLTHTKPAGTMNGRSYEQLCLPTVKDLNIESAGSVVLKCSLAYLSAKNRRTPQ